MLAYRSNFSHRTSLNDATTTSRASSPLRLSRTTLTPPAASAQEAKTISGVVFEPFSAVESELATTQKASVRRSFSPPTLHPPTHPPTLHPQSSSSFGRTDFHAECEAAINEQINVEYNVSYVYHAMYTYFARDNVGLTNIAEFFKKESAEERHHAELLMEYQIKRGGAVKLETILPPHTEFDHAEKGDALYAFELALSLEKLNFQKLRQLHEVAEKHGDSQMCDFVEGTLLADQMESVYEVAEKVAQLRRVGKGLGVYVFDQELGA